MTKQAGKGKGQAASAAQEQEIPRGQKFFDNWIVLFIISIAITGILYTAWGLFQVLTLPPSPIP
jgi:hypothetical protein